MYRLYGSAGSGSAAVEAALAESGANYVAVTVNTGEGEHLSAEFAAVNPRKQVPALELPDGSVMTESAAMMLHLADAFSAAGLAPPPGSAARAQHDRWLLFMAVNIYEGELRRFYSDRYTDDAAGIKAVESNAYAYVQRHYAMIEDAIGTGPFLFGAQPSMADIYLWNLASWMDRAWFSGACPKLSRLVAAVRERPLVAPIHSAHFDGEQAGESA